MATARHARYSSGGCIGQYRSEPAVRPSNTAHSSSAIADIASITSLPFEFQSTRLFSSGLALTVRWPPFGLRLNRTPAPLVDAARAVYLKSEMKFDVPLVRVHKADRP